MAPFDGTLNMEVTIEFWEESLSTRERVFGNR
jgi:hypothetical protein